MKAGERDSKLATLGDGTPSRLTQANALRWLVDNEAAWGHVQEVIEFAGTHQGKLDIMQLQIDVDKFSHGFRIEKPLIVLRFDPNAPLDALHKRKLDEHDDRIERSLLAQVPEGRGRADPDSGKCASTGTASRRSPSSPASASLLILGACCSILIAVIAADLARRPDHRRSAADRRAVEDLRPVRPEEAQGLVRGRGRGSPGHEAHAAGHRRSATSAWRHCASARTTSFTPRWSSIATSRRCCSDRRSSSSHFDSQHLLEEPRRGANAKKGPIHEMSVAVRGPAVGHLQEVFNSHWNVADPSDTPLPVPPVPPTAPADLKSGEFRCAVQIVRTFDKMFAPATNGEKGVLEAYLRAIHFAERFIYIENQ